MQRDCSSSDSAVKKEQRSSKKIKNLEKEVKTIILSDESNDDDAREAENQEIVTPTVIRKMRKNATKSGQINQSSIINKHKKDVMPSSPVISSLASAETPRRSTRISLKQQIDYEAIIRRKTTPFSTQKMNKDNENDENALKEEMPRRWTPSQVGKYSSKRSRKSKGRKLKMLREVNDDLEQIESKEVTEKMPEKTETILESKHKTVENNKIQNLDTESVKADETIKEVNAAYADEESVNVVKEIHEVEGANVKDASSTIVVPLHDGGANVNDEFVEFDKPEYEKIVAIIDTPVLKLNENSVKLQDTEPESTLPKKGIECTITMADTPALVVEASKSNTSKSPLRTVPSETNDKFGTYLNSQQSDISDLGLQKIDSDQDSIQEVEDIDINDESIKNFESKIEEIIIIETPERKQSAKPVPLQGSDQALASILPNKVFEHTITNADGIPRPINKASEGAKHKTLIEPVSSIGTYFKSQKAELTDLGLKLLDKTENSKDFSKSEDVAASKHEQNQLNVTFDASDSDMKSKMILSHDSEDDMQPLVVSDDDPDKTSGDANCHDEDELKQRVKILLIDENEREKTLLDGACNTPSKQHSKIVRVATPHTNKVILSKVRSNVKFDIQSLENTTVALKPATPKGKRIKPYRFPTPHSKKTELGFITDYEPKEIAVNSIHKSSASISIEPTMPLHNQESFNTPANTDMTFDQMDSKNLKRTKIITHQLNDDNVTKRRKRSVSLNDDAEKPSSTLILSSCKKMKPVIKRTKLPNFKAMHQKQFNAMENILEHVERKAERAKLISNSSTKLRLASTQKKAAIESLHTKPENTKARKNINLLYKDDIVNITDASAVEAADKDRLQQLPNPNLWVANNSTTLKKAVKNNIENKEKPHLKVLKPITTRQASNIPVAVAIDNEKDEERMRRLANPLLWLKNNPQKNLKPKKEQTVTSTSISLSSSMPTLLKKPLVLGAKLAATTATTATSTSKTNERNPFMPVNATATTAPASTKYMQNKPAFNLSTKVGTTNENLNAKIDYAKKVEERRQRHQDLYKSRANAKHTEATSRADVIRGVRSNRRFQLQMEHRRNLNQ